MKSEHFIYLDNIVRGRFHIVGVCQRFEPVRECTTYSMRYWYSSVLRSSSEKRHKERLRVLFINPTLFIEPSKVLYTTSGDIRRVTITSSERRTLAGAQYEDKEGIDRHAAEEGIVNDRRRLYPCNDCEDTWNVVCSDGVPSVCDLVGYGTPFSTEASAAVQLLCSTFGDACSGSSGNEACEGQCVGDDIDDDDNYDDDNGDDDSGGAGIVVPTKHPSSRNNERQFHSSNTHYSEVYILFIILVRLTLRPVHLVSCCIDVAFGT